MNISMTDLRQARIKYDQRTRDLREREARAPPPPPDGHEHWLSFWVTDAKRVLALAIANPPYDAAIYSGWDPHDQFRLPGFRFEGEVDIVALRAALQVPFPGLLVNKWVDPSAGKHHPHIELRWVYDTE